MNFFASGIVFLSVTFAPKEIITSLLFFKDVSISIPELKGARILFPTFVFQIRKL